MLLSRNQRRKRNKRRNLKNKIKGIVSERYTRLAIFSLEEIFDHIPFDINGKPDNNIPNQKEYNNQQVHMTSIRYILYKVKGTTCKECGIVGTFFSLDLPRNCERPHFNLYGYDEEGNEVMITKDHIHPKSKGGSDKLDNLQPLCERCNCKKGDKEGI